MDWQFMRSMTAGEFRQAIALLGMSQAAASRYLGLSERQVARMVHAEADVPVPVALLLNSLLAHKERPDVPSWVPGAY